MNKFTARAGIVPARTKAAASAEGPGITAAARIATVPSSLFGDPAPLLERADLDALLASDLELADLVRGAPEAHVSRERARVTDLLRGGGRAFVGPASIALLRPLAWDTRHFGVEVADVARVYAAGVPDDDVLAHLLGHAASAGIALLSARCRADQPAVAQALETRGFRWVDTSVELGREVDRGPALPASDGRVREARPDDAPALRVIAREFRRNRFHFDARIPADQADGVYEQWVTSAAEGRGERMLVAEEDGRAVGLCGYRAPPSGDALHAATLTLIVVAEEARGRGLFDALLGRTLALSREDGARRLVSSTQVHNGRSLRAFARAGLLPYSARHVFHRWAT